jgi:crotonobetainyl-CoA:carnitine CoA-transferase CaiB-like acyl-CoA transferase
MNRPLEGLVVLEFSQYLAGPCAGLRLADLGARVIKIERPGSGDACRQLAIKNLFADGDSLVFHTINRNKESYAANLKSKEDLENVKRLIARADLMTHNFRPGVMEKLGLDFASVRALNSSLIYGVVTGYGKEGPWRDKPGQDLLAQSMSGLTWLSGDADDPPVPFGLAIADMLCGEHLVQGLLAALLRRTETGQGALVEVSLMESMIDFQFEVLTTHFNDGGQPPRRSSHRNAHAYLGAPYGLYQTRDGWIAIAMGCLASLGELIDCKALIPFADRWDDPFEHRDEIKKILQQHLKTQTTQHWLNLLEAADYWCADVLNYGQLLTHEGYQVLGMDQIVRRLNGTELRTLRCPIHIDGQRLYSNVAAPVLGNSNEILNTQLEESPKRHGDCLAEGELGNYEEGEGTNPSYQAVPNGCASLLQEGAVPDRRNRKPLEGFLVVDFSQFLSGPSAALRLADLGARVIKIERPGCGDIGRRLYVSNVVLDGESSVFHAINRNKESFAADLKNYTDRERVRRLVAKADVVMHNFRPGVMQRLGFDYESVRAFNPKVVYGAVSGYGNEGPWRDKPGQDLLVQALSGLTWLSGNDGDGPVPMGLAVVDILAGAQLAQGILACLVRRSLTGKSGLVEVSMLETILDFQFESLTSYFQDGGQEPQRTRSNNAHAYLGAPYGIYETADGHLALAMGEVSQLGHLLSCPELLNYPDPVSWFHKRDEIKAILARQLKTKSTADWLAVLEPADIWCAEVFDWKRLTAHKGYRVLRMEQTVRRGNGFQYKTTTCPIRLDGERLQAGLGSPKLGEHTEEVVEEFKLGGGTEEVVEELPS